MHFLILLLLLPSCISPTDSAYGSAAGEISATRIIADDVSDSTSWTFFLQHLPQKPGPVLDYTGTPVDYQEKHSAVIDFDIGKRDLQQCADALMRLRAEYLFTQKRLGEISFHFTNGHLYSFTDYCKGKRPVPKGTNLQWMQTTTATPNHQNLRRYLDIVYTYAGTISLSAELKEANEFATGVVVIKGGSPGHSFIIIDEAKLPTGEKVFKLAEGYTPAQSIYVLRNLTEPELGAWHRLKKGPLKTASYEFYSYKLKKFE